MAILEKSAHQERMEAYRHKSEMFYDLLIVIIGLLISIMSNFTIGLTLLTLCLISHYTSARMLLFAKWNHSREAIIYNKITQTINILNGLYIVAYIIYLFLA